MRLDHMLENKPAVVAVFSSLFGLFSSLKKSTKG